MVCINYNNMPANTNNYGDCNCVYVTQTQLGDEEIPDELSSLVRKAGDGLDSSPPPSAVTSANVTADSVEQGEGGGEVSGGEEVSLLRAQLEEVESRNQQLVQEVGELREKNAELSRRYQDATRAYEQERRVSSETVKLGRRHYMGL